MLVVAVPIVNNRTIAAAQATAGGGIAADGAQSEA